MKDPTHWFLKILFQYTQKNTASMCVYVCLHPSTVKASSVSNSWDCQEQINDAVLKTLDSSTGSLHLYFGLQNLTFQLAALSCLYTRSGHSHDLTSICLAFRT